MPFGEADSREPQKTRIRWGGDSPTGRGKQKMVRAYLVLA